MNRVDIILDYLDYLIPNPYCELKYSKDYELLIAVMLSAQTLDKRVNKVGEVLFEKYSNIDDLSNAKVEDVEQIIKELGNYRKKAQAVVAIAKILKEKAGGVVPCDMKFLESLPMVGHKSASVVLGELYNVPTMPVDTHVERTSKRLGLAKDNDSIMLVEQKLKRKIPKDKWCGTHKQLVLFGRYYCKSKNPDCTNCKLNEICKKKK